MGHRCAGSARRRRRRTLLGTSERREFEARVTTLESHRIRAVDSAEAERRRIERDLHDGAQQRLIAVAMQLGVARQRLDDDPASARALVDDAHAEVKSALKELRDLVRGIHPVILQDRGLDAALSAVVARTSVPVDLRVDLPARPPAAVESAAYFIVSEALVNVVRHVAAFLVFWGAVQLAGLVRSSTSESATSFDASSIRRIVVTTDNGDVRVVRSAGDREQVRASVQTGLTDPDHSERATGRDLRLDAACSNLAGPRCSVSYAVEVPMEVVDRITVEVTSDNGDITIEAMPKVASVSSDNGDITARGIGGTATLRSENGDVTVSYG